MATGPGMAWSADNPIRSVTAMSFPSKGLAALKETYTRLVIYTGTPDVTPDLDEYRYDSDRA